MTRQRAGSGLEMLAALGCLGAAWPHGTGHDPVPRLAAGVRPTFAE